MSSPWSNANFDIFTPSVTIKLNTTGTGSGGSLQYVGGSVLQEPQTNYCWSDCEISPGCGDNCNPNFNPDICPPNNPNILTFTGPMTETGQSEGCTDVTSAVQCQQTQTNICAVFDGAKTCSLGTYGKASCNGGCNQNTDWAITSANNWLVGWCNCNYNYDYTNYHNRDSPSDLANWINSVFNDVGVGAPTGMDPNYKIRIRDANFIYATILDFYNQVYNTGYYENNNNLNNFSDIDFISGYTDFSKSVISQLQYFLTESYPKGVPTQLSQNLLSNLILPTPSQNNNVYQISIPINYSQYQAYQASSDQDSLISSYVNNLLRDNQGVMSNTTQSWNPNGPSLTSSVVNSITAINMTDYTMLSVSPPGNFTQKTYPNYLFLTAEITATVSVWSPMLVVYFQAYNSTIKFSPDVCTEISAHAGSQSPYSSTIPPSCFEADCASLALRPQQGVSSKNNCKQDIMTYCDIAYSPPPYTSRTETDKYLLTNNNTACYCYTSVLPPVNQRNPGNPGGMCFDSACSNSTVDVRALFGLTDNVCKGYCQEVYDWLHATGSDQPGNANELDAQRFSTICGTNFQPYTSATWNTSIIVIGLVTTVLVGLLIFSICKYKAYSTTKTTVLIIAGCILLLGLTFFFGKDMAGIFGGCVNGNMTCKSRISKIKIPTSFCTFQINCECQSDEDCPGSCVCASGSCAPLNGSRPTKVIQERKVNIIILVITIISLIVLPLIIIYLHRDYHWNISKGLFSGILGAFIIIPLVYVIYLIFKKYNKTVFTGPCCTPKCENKECGPDGCGGLCPKPGSIFPCASCDDNGQCVNPIPGSYQIIYHDPNTGKVSALSMSSGLTGGYKLEMVPVVNNTFPQPAPSVIYKNSMTSFPQDLHWNYDGTNLTWHSDTGVVTTYDNTGTLFTHNYCDQSACMYCSDPEDPNTCKEMSGGYASGCGIFGNLNTQFVLGQDGSLQAIIGGNTVYLAPAGNELGIPTVVSNDDIRAYGWNYISFSPQSATFEPVTKKGC